jgi:hypothetical protein
MGAAECTDFHNDNARMTVARGSKGSTTSGVRVAPRRSSICQTAILSTSGRRASRKGIVVDLNRTNRLCRYSTVREMALEIPLMHCKA